MANDKKLQTSASETNAEIRIIASERDLSSNDMSLVTTEDDRMMDSPHTSDSDNAPQMPPQRTSQQHSSTYHNPAPFLYRSNNILGNELPSSPHQWCHSLSSENVGVQVISRTQLGDCGWLTLLDRQGEENVEGGDFF
eukprot:CAMPEP_0117455762 /NCGR_PEP_ID=MMETSP0759-20121206/11531_1 /TAXON_ID=63605 /ORGANISM="Percolomonas cosmopolitus, Strain WS" /LENGTH=137 /DNA_ID=CAMNT_0005249085 /DNA_START=138 /DNA_END=548 /DNA_ORIENTATION=-